jgi:predicted MFS family arabinose efflux permease
VLGRTLDDSYPEAIRRDVTTIAVARLSGHALYRYVGPFIAVVARGLDVTVTELGVALTITGSTGFAAPLIGRLVDRISRRAAIAWGLGGCSAGGFVAATSTSLVWFTVGLAMIASLGMVLVVGAGAWIVDHVPFERRGRIVGLVETAWALGLLVGVSTLGLVTALSSWRWAYVVGASVAAGVAVVAWRRIGSETPDRRAPEPVETPVAAVITRMSRAGWFAVLGVVGLVCASEALFVTFGAWLKDDFDVNDGVLAAATFALGAMELGASSLSSMRTDRWGKERSVIGGALVMAVAAVGLLTLQDWALPGMVAVAIFIGCFEFSIVSAIPIAGDLVPGNPARGIALLMASSAIGRGITTIPTTWLYDRHGIGASAALAAGWTFVAAAMMAARLRAARSRPAI